MGDKDDPKPDEKKDGDSLTWWQRIVVSFCTMLFAVGFLIGILEYLKFRNFVPNEPNSFKLSGPSSIGLEITHDQAGITLKQGEHTITVVNVPAYRMATPTGIRIHRKDEITITASGTIATSQGYNDWFKGTDYEIYGSADSNNVLKELKVSQFAREANPNWRGPDGERLFDPTGSLDSNEGLFTSGNPLDKAVHEAHEIHKLAPYRNYGLLMGCMIDPRTEPGNLNLIEAVTAAANSNRIFAIGFSNHFSCEQDGPQTFLYFDCPHMHKTNNGVFYDRKRIPMDTDEGEFVLLINDVVVTPKTLNDVISACGTNEERKTDYLMVTNIFSSEMAKNMRSNKIPFEVFARELWYWDNVGSFTVTIDKKSE